MFTEKNNGVFSTYLPAVCVPAVLGRKTRFWFHPYLAEKRNWHLVLNGTKSAM